MLYKIQTEVSLRAKIGATVWAVSATCCLLLSCRGSDRYTTVDDSAAPLRPVRVLVVSDVQKVRFRSRHSLSVLNDGYVTMCSSPGGNWLVVEASQDGGISLGKKPSPAQSVTILSDPGETVQVAVATESGWSEGVPYPGSLRVSARQNGRLCVINYVGIERYVASVVACEVWPTFAKEAFRAQAVAARTYVIYQMLRRQDAAWDVAATQGSQVYRGVRTDRPGLRAYDATEFTRGVICTFGDDREERLFSTYYSSVCGGVTQSAAIFGEADAVAPLAGGVRCDYCRIAPKRTYRWGPVRIAVKKLRDRLAARYPDIGSLGEITSVSAVERTPNGRPVELRIAGSNGKSHTMLAERFRLAVGSNTMRSTDCNIRLVGKDIVFEKGRGYGHGLGLCQWGMQGQALEGKRAGEILRYYYPTSKLTRVY
ncbi:MAG: SpoIID/LytB domain-containing protein [Phycisphaerales bacterium]|nr:MAG: SpoIID/LytB domain-containing protein [Phycisphaerales bacterium]